MQSFLGKSSIPQKRPYNVPIERMFETWRISVMRSSIRVLVKVVLFQLRGRGHPQNDARPNIFPDSKSLLLGLSNEVSFVSELLWDGCQNSWTFFMKTCCMISIAHHCTVVGDIIGRGKLIIWWVLIHYFGLYQKPLSKNGQISTFKVHTYHQGPLRVQYLGIN